MKLQKSRASFGRTRSQRGTKSDMIAYAGIVAYIISLGSRIPLSRTIGDAGIGLFAPAFEIFTLCTLLFTYGISRTMTGLLRYRVKREQFKSARKVFRITFRMSVLLGAVLALIIAVMSGFLSEIVVLEAMSRKAIAAMAPVIILTALTNVFRGYFSGNGFGVLVVHSQYIEKIAMLIATVIGGEMFYDYGKMAAAIVQNEMVAYAYGALGAVFGVMISEIITLIYLLLVFIIYFGKWRRQTEQNSGRRMESGADIIGMIIGNGLPTALFVVFANVFMLIDQRFFNYCMNKKEQEGLRTALWGCYYGKFAVLIGIGTALTCMAVHGSIGKIVLSYEREEYSIMRDRLGSAVKRLCITALPVAIYLAVLAEAFVKGLYQGDNTQTIDLVRKGCIIIFFYGLAYLFGQLMLKIHMMKELLFSLAVSLALHFAAAFLLVRKGLMGAEGIVYSVILFTVVLSILCFVFIGRRLKYRQEWLYSFAFPAVSACVAGLVVMMLNKVLLSAAGSLLTIVISCLVSTILYIILLMVLRVLSGEELAQLPFGNLWVSLGRMIGVL